MPLFLINFFAKPANIIGAILIAIILGLSSYNLILKHEISNRDKIILGVKNNLLISESNALLLKNSLNDQNIAIDKLHKEQITSQDNFNKSYNQLKESQKEIIKNITKQAQYVSPKGINECDASKMVISDFMKNRK